MPRLLFSGNRVGVLSLIALLAFARIGLGQSSSTTGAIDGRVVDNSGAVLPGVTVTLSGPSMMGRRSATTDEGGQYRFPSVPPGDYTLVYDLSGFSSVERRDIRVGIGFTATLNIEMGIAAVQESVTVAGVSPVVDAQHTQTTQTFTKDMINQLPGTREYWSLLSVAPGVQMNRIDVGGSAFLEIIGASVYGMNTQHRQMVEGIVAVRGTGNFYYADMGSFEEVALVSSGGNAESPTPGMGGNFISKSGGNRYSGSVYFGYQNEDIQSHNIDADQIARGVSGFGSVAATDTNRMIELRDVNVDIGGYLVKDRLWWYYSFRDPRSTVRLANVIGNSQLKTSRTNTGKVTYNPSNDIRLTGYMQRANKVQLPWLSSFRVPTASAIWEPNSAWIDEYPVGLWKVGYEHTLSSNLLAEVRGGNFFGDWRNWAEDTIALRYEDVGNNVVRGGNRGYDTLRDKPQVLGSISYFANRWAGTHNLKVGGEVWREVDTQNDHAYPQNLLHVLRNGAPIEVYLFESPNVTKGALAAQSAFVADTWRLNSRFTLDLGLRYDRYQPYLPEQSHLGLRFAAVDSLITWNHFAPRIGAVYDLSGRGSTVLKLNYGTYWWNPSSDFSNSLNPNQLQWYNLYAWNDANTDRVFQRGEEGRLLQTNGGVASQAIDPNLKNSFTRQATLMLEHEFMSNFGVRTGVVWLGTGNLAHRYDLNQPYDAFNVPTTLRDPGPDGRLDTSDDGGTVSAWNLSPQYLGLPTRGLTQNVEGARDDFYTWEMTANKRLSNRWSLLATFAKTWSSRSALALAPASVTPNPNVLINTADGQSQFTTWQAKLTTTVELPYDVQVTPLLRHQSGNNFGRTFVGALNYGNPTILAEEFDAERFRNITIFDTHVEKAIRVRGTRLAGFFDMYNIFNSNPEFSFTTSSGSSWMRPLSIVSPRIARFGARFEW